MGALLPGESPKKDALGVRADVLSSVTCRWTYGCSGMAARVLCDSEAGESAAAALAVTVRPAWW